MLKLKTDTANPIYERLTRHTNGPSIWVMIVISNTIGLAVLLGLLVSLSHYKSELVIYSLLLVMAFDMLSPAVMAVYAANLASKDLHEENLQMMKLAGITEKAMIEGYAEAAFNRLRLLAAAATALVPTIVIIGFPILMPTSDPVDLSLSGIGKLLMVCTPIVILFIFGLWLFHKLGCIWGASLAIWWERPILVMIVSSLTMLIFSPLSLCICLVIVAAVLVLL